MVFKKKRIVIYTTVFLLMLSLYLGLDFNKLSSDNNLTAASDNPDISAADDVLPGEAIVVSQNTDFYLKSKNDREIVRSKTTELLRGIIDDDKASAESKQKAENAIISIAQEMNDEVKIESLLNAKGFKNSIVFISNNSVTVTLKTENLSDNDMAKINDIVSEICDNNNIKIVEVS